MFHKLNQRQHATVLAALRCYQQVLDETSGDLPDDLLDIATNGGAIERLELDEIDDLCMELNA